MLDIMGPQEVADFVGVKEQTVRSWRTKGLLPEPDRMISRVPIWSAGRIIRWAVTTGRVTAETIERKEGDA